MEKRAMNATTTKKEFAACIYRCLLKMLKDNDNEQYSDMFKLEGASIMCKLPPNFFASATIPENTTIEMKFITKKV